MKTVEISLENARTAYNEADGEIRQTLLRLIGRTVLFDDITEVVKSYEDACEIEGIEPLTLDSFALLPEKDREYHFYDHQMNVITRALNEGWEPDYDTNEEKWEIWWNMRSQAAGGPGFSFVVYDYAYSGSLVGARRVYKTKKLAMYSATQFIDIHQKIQSLKK